MRPSSSGEGIQNGLSFIGEDKFEVNASLNLLQSYTIIMEYLREFEEF
ncbi:hypothetical protein [Prevotella disiens]|uniref:Uncharacterized protein n=1 Tax=Prevotella disiens JCM 6334 = ATCC 29426 TaxID=1235811 RepID=A0ABN0NNN8_9BACT|nr:hypothetical protein [Prevotella disiens]ERJ71014.1 hypothetical protein HMPREF0653_02616 [Prevotella disiens JCM 6334 = ATCC 29426]